MNRVRMSSWRLAGLAIWMALAPLAAVAAGEADPADVNALLKQMIQDLAKAREDNEALQAQLKAAQLTAAQLDAQNRELDATNRRLRAVLRDLASRGFPVYEVLGKTAAATNGQPAAPDLPPEVATRLAQLLEIIADAPDPRPDHKEDWDWTPAAQAARNELVKLGAPAVDPLLGLAAHSANPVVKMRAGAMVLQIRQQSQQMVSAKVLDVGDRNDLVSIGLGENQGVKVGQVFLILRGNDYVGQSKVTRVWGDLCVAQALDRQGPAQVGDQALALIDRSQPAPATPPDQPAGPPAERPLLPGVGRGLLPATPEPAPNRETPAAPLTPRAPRPPELIQP